MTSVRALARHRIQQRRVLVCLASKSLKHRRSGRRIWHTEAAEQDAHRPPGSAPPLQHNVTVQHRKVSVLAAEATVSGPILAAHKLDQPRTHIAPTR